MDRAVHAGAAHGWTGPERVLAQRRGVHGASVRRPGDEPLPGAPGGTGASRTAPRPEPWERRRLPSTDSEAPVTMRLRSLLSPPVRPGGRAHGHGVYIEKSQANHSSLNRPLSFLPFPSQGHSEANSTAALRAGGGRLRGSCGPRSSRAQPSPRPHRLLPGGLEPPRSTHTRKLGFQGCPLAALRDDLCHLPV